MPAFMFLPRHPYSYGHLPLLPFEFFSYVKYPFGFPLILGFKNSSFKI
jgi:hypothetical protein